MDVEAAVLPRHKQVYVPLCDGAFVQQHGQNLVPEELLQCKAVVIAGNMKAVGIVKAAVGDDDVAMGIEAEEVAKSLDGAGTTGDG